MSSEIRDTLYIFFNKIIENSINDQMMEYAYVFPYQKLTEYVMTLCSIPFSDYLEYLKTVVTLNEITSEDITQISDFANCEINYCNKLAGVRRPLTSIDVGIILQDDGVIRTDVANLKYGENQSKGALHLGLAQNRYGYWYLSCLGILYPKLDNDIRKALLARTILRNPFYADLVSNLYSHDICIDNIWGNVELSLKTKYRRRSSVRHFLLTCINQAYKEGFAFNYKLDFSIGNSKEILEFIPKDKVSGLESEPLVPNITKSFDYYINCINNLHVNRNGDNSSPHKYILLLTIILLAEKGFLKNNIVELNDLLEGTYGAIWDKYIPKNSPFRKNVEMPYSHMNTEPFWHVNESICFIDNDLFYYISKSEYAEKLRSRILLIIKSGNVIKEGSLILERKIEWTIFSEGFTILKQYHSIWNNNLGLVQNRGDLDKIILNIDGEKYEVDLMNIRQSSTDSALIQVRYNEKDQIANKIKNIFCDTYEFCKKVRDEQGTGKKKPVKIPDEYRYVISLYTTDIPKEFILKYNTTNKENKMLSIIKKS